MSRWLRLRSLLRRERALVALTLAAAFLLFYRLDQHHFWADEAITAFYARSIVTSGRGLPSAWDGRNLVAFGGGGSLDRNLRPTPYPMLQFYLAAPFFALFGRGHETFAGRFPFALLGLATVPLTYWLALQWTRQRAAALAAAILLATSVQFLLFARQCRYYALTGFFCVLLLLLYRYLGGRRRGILAGFILVAFLLFHSHFMIFYTFMGALGTGYLIADRDRRRLWPLLFAAAILLVLTVPYVVAFAIAGAGEAMEAGEPKTWFDRLTLFGWYLRDLNRATFFPVLAVPLLPLLWLPVTRANERPRDQGADPNPALFFLTVIVAQVMLTCAVSDEPVRPPHKFQDASLRYIVNILPLTCILLGMICARVRQWSAWAAVPMLGILVFTNFFTLERPRSFFADYLRELSRGYKTSTSVVVEVLKQATREDDLVLVEPPYQRDPLIFYLGDRLRFCSVLSPDDTHLLPRHRERLPAYIYSGEVVPDWMVMFGRRRVRHDISRYLEEKGAQFDRATLPVHWQDRSRPELIWHLFSPMRRVAEHERVFVWRLVGLGGGQAAQHPAASN